MQEGASESRPSRGGIHKATPLSLEEIRSISERKLGIRDDYSSKLAQHKESGLTGDYVTIWNIVRFKDDAKRYNECLHEYVSRGALGFISPDNSIHWREYKQDMTLGSYLAKRFPNDFPAFEIIDDFDSMGEPYDTQEYYNFGKAGKHRISPERILKTVSLDENDIETLREAYKKELSLPINSPWGDKSRLEVAILIDVEDVLMDKILTGLRAIIQK